MTPVLNIQAPESAFEQAYLARYRERHPHRPEPCQGLQHYLFHRAADGDYTHPIVREAHAMWQAALAELSRGLLARQNRPQIIPETIPSAVPVAAA